MQGRYFVSVMEQLNIIGLTNVIVVAYTMIKILTMLHEYDFKRYFLLRIKEMHPELSWWGRASEKFLEFSFKRSNREKHFLPLHPPLVVNCITELTVWIYTVSQKKQKSVNICSGGSRIFAKGAAAAGAFGVPQAPSCPLSLRPLRKFRGS